MGESFSRKGKYASRTFQVGELATALSQLGPKLLGDRLDHLKVYRSDELPDGSKVSKSGSDFSILETACSFGTDSPSSVSIEWHGNDCTHLLDVMLYTLKDWETKAEVLHAEARAKDPAVLNRFFVEFQAALALPDHPPKMASAVSAHDTPTVKTHSSMVESTTAPSVPDHELAKEHIKGRYDVLKAAIAAAGSLGVLWVAIAGRCGH